MESQSGFNKQPKGKQSLRLRLKNPRFSHKGSKSLFTASISSTIRYWTSYAPNGAWHPWTKRCLQPDGLKSPRFSGSLNKNLGQLKVAIIHDVLLEYGGSERVLEELLDIFPSADFYTLYFNKRNPPIYSTFNKANPETSFLQHIPGLYKLKQYFSITKLGAWPYFYNLDLSDYDLVISSSSSYNTKAVRVSSDSLHVCYLHTPPKYLYREINEIGWIKEFPFNFILFPIFEALRFVDKKAASHPGIIIVNSLEVKNRVAKYYQRESVVIHPPVELPKKLSKKDRKKSYFVTHSRLVRQKGVGLAVEVATRYKLPLVVIGDGYLRGYLEKMAGPTVTFKGWVRDEEIPKIYSQAKALINCSIDEDFGIAPLEAMGFGVPVIAYESGGVKETVIDGKTGVFFKKFTSMSLYAAIKKFEKVEIEPSACYQQAGRFGKKRFRKEFLEIINKNIHE